MYTFIMILTIGMFFGAVSILFSGPKKAVKKPQLIVDLLYDEYELGQDMTINYKSPKITNVKKIGLDKYL
jgi:hypothetical protein